MASTSERAYVWAWLPGHTHPIPVGALNRRGGTIAFAYGRRYLQRPDAISLWDQELPLEDGWQEPPPGREIASCLRDAAPDHWGRRVILDRIVGRRALHDGVELDELAYLREASSDRVGALDVQDSPGVYIPRHGAASLDEVEQAAHLLDEGSPIPEELRLALQSGTGAGGARPKALLEIGGRHYIAKFSTTSDDPAVPPVSAEAVSIELARRVGIPVPDSRLVEVRGRRALLVERFDRTSGGGRRMMLSGHTLTGATESLLDRGSYVELFDILRRRCSQPRGVPGPRPHRRRLRRRKHCGLVAAPADVGHIRSRSSVPDRRCRRVHGLLQQPRTDTGESTSSERRIHELTLRGPAGPGDGVLRPRVTTRAEGLHVLRRSWRGRRPTLLRHSPPQPARRSELRTVRQSGRVGWTPKVHNVH